SLTSWPSSITSISTLITCIPPNFVTPRIPSMAKVLTAIACRNARPGAKRREIPDAGCRGLYLIVQPSGAKSWGVRFRFRSLPRKLTLGSFLDGGREPDVVPEIDTPLSLAAARELATRALRQVGSGVDPTVTKRARRVAQRAAEADTLAAISQEFLRRKEPQRADDQLRSDLELLCESQLGRLPVEQIRRGQFARVFDHIADTRGPVRSDRVRSSLNRALNWHAGRSDYVNVLGRGGRRTSIRERARTKVLNDPELKAVVGTAEQHKGDPFAGLVLFDLHTGARRGEVAALKWDELSDGGQTWIIPAHRYKTNRDTLIPLSKAAQRIIAERPHLGPFVFGVAGARPLGGFSKRKREF